MLATLPGYPGYVLDGCGLLRRALPGELLDTPAPVYAAPRATAPDLPVYPVAIGGRMPDPQHVAAIREAVARIPSRHLRTWIDGGGRLEILPGTIVTAHPRRTGNSPALGFCEFNGTVCIVAGDSPEAPATARHEIAHAVDTAMGFPSRGPEWMRIWRDDLLDGRVPSYAQQRERPGEYFAETCSQIWGGIGWKASKAARGYLQNLS